jgi:Spy/CpxP family protein refolding chaperone
MIPDLTEEQKEQIKGLRVDHIKEMTQVRNKLMEKRASLRTLQTQDNPDMAAINKTIEEMGEVRTSLQKARAEHHQAIREILTEEQRTFFDARLKRGHRMAGCYGKRPMRGRPFRQGL